MHVSKAGKDILHPYYKSNGKWCYQEIGKGIPFCVLQEEKKLKREIIKVRGTVKAAVLEGDDDCPSLVCTSVYDTKPVHFMSTICDSIKWITKKRRVFNVSTQMWHVMDFLRLNINDGYNAEMGHVDISDQLRNQYRFDHWLRMQKWWFAIFFGAFGVLMINSFVVYKLVHTISGTPKGQVLSHFDYRKSIAISWIKDDDDIMKASRLQSNHTRMTSKKMHQKLKTTMVQKALYNATDRMSRKKMRKDGGYFFEGGLEIPRKKKEGGIFPRSQEDFRRRQQYVEFF